MLPWAFAAFTWTFAVCVSNPEGPKVLRFKGRLEVMKVTWEFVHKEISKPKKTVNLWRKKTSPSSFNGIPTDVSRFP